MKKDFLENAYIVMTACGVYDRGLDKAEDERYFGMSNLDTDGDGVISDEENQAVKARLYAMAIDAGAGEILEKFDGIVPKHLCVDFSKGGTVAKDDVVSTFDRGQKIIINKDFVNGQGIKPYGDATDEDIYSGDTDMLRFMESRGLIIGTRFFKEDGTLDLEKLAGETPKEIQDPSHPTTASYIQVEKEHLDSFKGGLATAKTLFSYLSNAYPLVKPASIIFSVTDYILDKDLVGSNEKESFIQAVKRIAGVA